MEIIKMEIIKMAIIEIELIEIELIGNKGAGMGAPYSLRDWVSG